MNDLFQDLWFAVRKFRRSPGLVFAAVVTLALGIGANTALFSLVDAVLLRPLQITDPSHLVSIVSEKKTAVSNQVDQRYFSFAEYTDIRDHVPALASVAAVSNRGLILKTEDGQETLMARVVSDNYFAVMGAQAAIGRLPTEEELKTTQTPVIVLGHNAWKNIFRSDPTVLGRPVSVNGGMVTVVGVLPVGFRGIDRLLDPQVFVPQTSWVNLHPEERNLPRSVAEYSLYARLVPGATLGQADTQVQIVGRTLARQYPATNAGYEFVARPTGDAKKTNGVALLLLALTGSVLLICCANVANLFLALNDSRQKEMGTRIALGASRGRLLRQLLAEYAALAAIGMACALWLAHGLLAKVPGMIPDLGFPIGFDLRMDHRVLAFTASMTLLSVLLCGLKPALSATRVAPLDAMRAQGSSNARLRMPARKIFVTAQVAASMALLVASGLLVRSMWNMVKIDTGFNHTQNAVLLNIEVNRAGAQRLGTYAALVNRMKALPGVTDASVARVVPFGHIGDGATKVVLTPGEAISPTAGTPVHFNEVDDAYFRVMGVGIPEGRAFGREDTPGGVRVAVVNRALAKKLFDGTAIGRHVRLGRENGVDVEIVGVAQDGKYNDLLEAPQPYLYLPLTQESSGDTTMIVTTAGDPTALVAVTRKALREVDPEISIAGATTMRDQMEFATYPSRMAGYLTASIGGLALLLTAVGLYGVISYTVSRRTHEIGIRVALGAARGQVFRQIVKEALKPVMIGITLGALVSVLLGKIMVSQALLYGVKAADPISLLSAAVLMLTISSITLIGPVSRALHVEPMDALREE